MLAPLGGGIVAFARRRPRWLLGGVATAIAMCALIIEVSSGQTWLMS